MRTVFMGTGEISLPSLRWLLEQPPARLSLQAVFTQPDKKVGRKQILTAPEVKTLALGAGIPVYQPESLKTEESKKLVQNLEPDLIVVMAYGQILPRAVIGAARVACVNLHASLLPRHRGASPIQAAIREGDEQTGLTLMHVAPRLDSGALISKITTPIHLEDTGQTLHDRLADLGPVLLEQGWPLLCQSPVPGEEQNEERVTYCGKLERECGELDWSAPAVALERLLRAYDPWPGCYTWAHPQGKKIKCKIFPPTAAAESPTGAPQPPGTVTVHPDHIQVACGEGSLLLRGDMQWEGRKRLPMAEFLRGAGLATGDRLGAC